MTICKVICKGQLSVCEPYRFLQLASCNLLACKINPLRLCVEKILELVMTTNNGHFVPGLQGVVAAETNLSSVDGLKGELIIAGFPV